MMSGEVVQMVLRSKRVTASPAQWRALTSKTQPLTVKQDRPSAKLDASDDEVRCDP